MVRVTLVNTIVWYFSQNSKRRKILPTYTKLLLTSEELCQNWKKSFEALKIVKTHPRRAACTGLSDAATMRNPATVPHKCKGYYIHFWMCIEKMFLVDSNNIIKHIHYMKISSWYKHSFTAGTKKIDTKVILSASTCMLFFIRHSRSKLFLIFFKIPFAPPWQARAPTHSCKTGQCQTISPGQRKVGSGESESKILTEDVCHPLWYRRWPECHAVVPFPQQNLPRAKIHWAARQIQGHWCRNSGQQGQTSVWERQGTQSVWNMDCLVDSYFIKRTPQRLPQLHFGIIFMSQVYVFCSLVESQKICSKTVLKHE